MLQLSSTTGQRQRKEKQLNAMTTPTRSAPSATGRQYRPGSRPRRARRPGKIGAGTDTPTPVARGGPLHRSAPGALFFWTVHGPFSFRARPKRKWGVHPGWTSPPAGAETRWPPSGGPYHLNPSGRCVPTGNPQTPQSSLPRQSSRAHRDNALRFHNIDMPAGLSSGIPPFLAVFFFGFCGALSAAVQKNPKILLT